ncbi:MAG: hypothetical protein KJ646_03160 [Nanoarchaeota archaeon]|nr:hypothetical protein [Nanoarchaeota archaeon]MBU4116749.1 hypothetical protein [Nanoarchaeota archaeon]
MKNLAGVKEADQYIQEELYLAEIELVRGEQSGGEVPYSIIGKLSAWEFRRAWYYWMASAQECNGLPLEVAAQLHEREYPIIGEDQLKNYGQVVRVVGHCGCPHPREWAFPTRKVIEAESKRIGQDLMRTTYGDLAKLCNSGVVQGDRFVNSYHIDNQLGLNEFARVLREQCRKN